MSDRLIEPDRLVEPDGPVAGIGALAGYIGRSTEPFPVEVERGAIRRFAQSIGDLNPLRHDVDAAQAQGWPGLVAPPTFAASFRPPQDFPWLAPLDRSRMRAGEQVFQLMRPIISGDRLWCHVTLSAVEPRQARSGPLLRLVQDLVALDEQGETVCINQRIGLYLGFLD